MSMPRLLAATAAILLVTACATPEERAAKRELKQARQEEKLQRIQERAATQRNYQAAAANTPTTDQNTPLENVLKAFSACDASLSATLNHYATQIEPVFPVTVKGNAASISIPNKALGQSSVRAAAGTMAYGQPVSGYFDEVKLLNGLPDQVSWGFYSPTPAAELVRRLGARVVNFQQVKLDVGGAYIRMDIYDGTVWRRTTRYATYRNRPDNKGERSFTMEPSSDPAFPGTRIACTLRGTQLPQLLPVLRPDQG